MELVSIDIKEFKKDVYEDYKKLFPEEERKAFKHLKSSFEKGITTFLKIMIEEKFIGFFIVNIVKDIKCAHLDYFAILPEYQSKGYGTEAIRKLKEEYKDYYGIFIEIEKVGEGKTLEENEIRQKRANFYERIGFSKMKFDIDLYQVIYSAYILQCSVDDIKEENVIEDIWEIYRTIMGEKRLRKNCKVIKDIGPLNK